MTNPWPVRLRSSLALVAAAALLFLCAWIVVPAPTYALLTFSVGAPEESVWLLTLAVLILSVAWIDRASSNPSRIACVLATMSLLLAAMPLIQFPITSRQFDAATREALGEEFLRDVPAVSRSTMRARPLIVVDLFRGIDPGVSRLTRGIVFATQDGIPLALDVYRPPGAGRYPIVVQIYGGAWQRGSPADNALFARYLAARGYVVVCPDYRHAPRWQWPTQIDDVRAALGWVRQHAAEYDGDPSRIALIGRSAGAHLALLAAYEPQPVNAPPIRSVVSYYGPADLTDAYLHPPTPDPLHVRATESAFMGGSPAARSGRYRDASPITYAIRQLPPTLLVYGARDHIVEAKYGERLHDRLKATKTTAILLEIPWADHAFDAVPNGISAQLALYHTERFLAWTLRER